MFEIFFSILQVVQVCPVSGEKWLDPSTLHPSLRLGCPLLALATSLPSLHLVDLALDINGKFTF